MRGLQRVSAPFLLGLLLLTRCAGGDGEGGVGIKRLGIIAVDPAKRAIELDVGTVSVGGVLEYEVRLLNNGTGDLTISGVELTYAAPASGDPKGTAFTLEKPGLPAIVKAKGGAGASTAVKFVVRFTRQPVFASRTAKVTIQSDTLDDADKNLVLTFTEHQSRAVATVSPKLVDFGVVPLGTTGKRAVQVTNTGSEDLVIDGFILRGHPDFLASFNGKDTPKSESTEYKTLIEPVVRVAPSSTVDVELKFVPRTKDPASGEIVLYANDSKGQAEGHTISLLANNDVPCIEVLPKALEFGARPIGKKALLPVEVRSCGQGELKISGIELDKDKSSLDFNLLLESPIDPQAPLAIDVNQSITFSVTCTPDQANPTDPDGKPIPDTGVVHIKNNGFEAIVDVPLTCAGVDAECPTAVIVVKEGEQVIPQTLLHLDGSQSHSPYGAIDSYSWKAKQPQGSTSKFSPNTVFPSPVFQADVAGSYDFILSVVDVQGNESCEPATATVVVIPDQAIHVELLWTTPGDTIKDDVGETKGADLDLHFAHPLATGPDIDGDTVPDPWFDKDFDCFWHNAGPNWGIFSPDAKDDPHLDRDDVDGWGPENLNLAVPEEGATYRVGVHYWCDWGFGTSSATIRVFVYGVLETEVVDVPLERLDLWNVAEIPWNAGATKTKVLKDGTGAFRITPSYVNPFFIAPPCKAPPKP